MSVQCRTFPAQRPCGLPDCERTDCNPRTVVPVPQRFMDIVTDRGIPFRVAFGNRMLNDGTLQDTPEVAFYDTRYEMTSPVHQHGQFVSSYLLETLLERESGYPMSLCGGIVDWEIDGTSMYLLRMWLVNLSHSL